jgi:hypothetical protein
MGNTVVSKTEENTNMAARRISGVVTGLITGHQPPTQAPTSAATQQVSTQDAHPVEVTVQQTTARQTTPVATLLTHVLKPACRDGMKVYCDAQNFENVRKVPHNYNFDPLTLMHPSVALMWVLRL